MIRKFSKNDLGCTQLCYFLNSITHHQHSEFFETNSNLDKLNQISLDLNNQFQLSKMGYRLMAQSYCKVTYLTLSNCGLTEETAQIVLNELRQIKYLNIVNNENIEGHCLQYLRECYLFYLTNVFV